MLSVIVSMLAFALVGSITPGPVNIIATASGARFGLWRTVPHVLGATIGYSLVVVATGLTLAEATRLLPRLSHIMAGAGAAFLLWMAYRIATAPTAETTAAADHQHPPRLTDGALVQVLNPKAWLWAMSGIGVFVTGAAPLSPVPTLLLFCLLSFAMCFLGVGVWAALGHLIRRILRHPGHQKRFNWAMGALLVISTAPLVPEILTGLSGLR